MVLLDIPFAGDLEGFLSEDVYPYRYPVTIALVLGLMAGIFIAYRLGWHHWAWKRRRVTGPALGLFLIIAIPVGYYLISPLVIRDTVCEASPIPGAGSGSEKCDDVAVAATMPPSETPGPEVTSAPTADATAEPTATPFTPFVAAEGEFRGADDFHFGNGKALLIETAPRVYTLRFEEFSVRNGPDLFVYLSTDPEGYSEDGINLGGLKGTDGAFNYEVPVGTDVAPFTSAIVWCKQFGTLFAVATFVVA